MGAARPQYQQAIELRRDGRLGEAERVCRQILQRRPCDFDALHLLGVLRLEQGDPREASHLIGEALEINPKSLAAHCNRGLAFAALHQHEEALASFDRALALDRRNADTLANRADTLCDLGRAGEALAGYDQALAVDPRHVVALVNRGVLLRELGRITEALASYEQAVAAEGSDAPAWNNRGVALTDLDRHTEALASYDRALALQPDYVEALFNRGNTLLALRRPAEAIVSYGRVLLLKPRHPDAHNNRGTALSALKRYEEALIEYQRALAIQPDHLDARVNRAGALQKLERYDEAIAEYERLRSLRPDLPNLLSDLVGCYAAACRWREIESLRTELLAAADEGRAAVDPFLLLGFDSNAEQQLNCARTWLRTKKLAGMPRQWNRADFSADKIRVVYLSADFHRHVTAYVMAEVFELHDRGRFEIIGVSFGPDDGSAIRSRLIKSFDRFFDVAARSDAEIAALVRKLGVHIAVDLKGHTTDARIGILAQRAAPVQASYMGFAATTGADFIDYVIADRIVLPFDRQPFYTERIVHLPDSYYANDRKRPLASTLPTRPELGLPESDFVFCCFNNSWKLNSRMFDIWMRLLEKVDGSVLWLFEPNELVAANLRREAQARGVHPQRLVFAAPRDLSDHLARLTRADLLLDTLPYNAHTTATDALWLGIPVLTCCGDTFVGRVGASLLHAIGLPELITADLDEYERLALKLASEPRLLQSLRHKLADHRLRFPLFDTQRFCRHLESAYATMWDTWQRGEQPCSFAVAPIAPNP